jgi:glutamine synthetase
MPRLRQSTVEAAQWRPNGSIAYGDLTTPSASGIFGANVFGPVAQRQRLPKDIFRQLQATIDQGQPLDPALADAVASAMKDWALEKGATHYAHWFQPLTGLTAEKHDSFYSPVGDGTSLADFSGKELIKGEPDASSFPSGGIRATFEARGYTAWDPTSPAFILENPNGAFLCIPTAFASWTGEALDTKIPLLRSMEALNKSALRALRLFGNTGTKRVFTTMGPEQEYFLIDKRFFYERPDLVNCGRTLFGAKPPKGHELDDHYFGTIPERVLAYMLECERELFKLGVPIKTRHNEVAPGQFELAPIFENSNVGTDHQQLTMQVLQNVAKRYDLVCLLHEKPFRGVNGSGKHNNWSMGTDDGENLLNPGDTPHENLQFLFFAAAVIAAVDNHQGLLRATVASAGQDHRLGANEAPPAIISIFLGEELESVFDAFAEGNAGVSATGELMGLGSPVLPELPRDSGDRNRTSPFAFTGNKFEFRALGANQSTSLPNTVLNTIAAEAIDDMVDQVEAKLAGGSSLTEVLPGVLAESYREHRRVVFAGDGYSQEWHEEAATRGLLNLRTTPDALPQLVADSTVTTLGNYDVLNQRELQARYEISTEQYVITVNTEAETAADIAATMILPAAVRYLGELDEADLDDFADELRDQVKGFIAAIKDFQAINAVHPEESIAVEAVYMRDKVIPAMDRVREIADKLERIIPDNLWPLPKYSEILFVK